MNTLPKLSSTVKLSLILYLNIIIIQNITPVSCFISTPNKYNTFVSPINNVREHQQSIDICLDAYQDFSEDDQQKRLVHTSNKKNIDKSSSSSHNNAASSSPSKKGKISMVGSGPGDPDLLTVRAYKLLTGADSNTLIISDRLVSKEILDLINVDNGVELKIARKHPGCAETAQEEIYKWVEEGLKLGKHVIRLKIGDPFVFGRGGEEVLRFRALGHNSNGDGNYDYEPTIIPGVSASLSAPLLGKIPITHRGISNQVVMCTGYGRNGTNPELIQYHKEQTVVFLMAVGRLREISANLINYANYPPTTPVGIIERAGCVDQRTIIGNLLTIADIAQEHTVKAPSTIVVGECVHVLYEDFGKEKKYVTGLITDDVHNNLVVNDGICV